jgi:hypothetical protein
MTGIRHWVRGQSGFEVDCGQQPKTRVVFGIFDQLKKSLAWYLFSSTVDSKSQRECATTGVWIVDDPFGIQISAATAHLFTNAIGVDQLVSGAKSPSATISLDTKTDNTFIYCSLDKLNTKSNGLVHLGFALRKVSKPPKANVAIPGKVFFLEIVPFADAKFKLGPEGKAALKALSDPVL